MADEDFKKASIAQLISAVEETKSYAFLIGAGTSRPDPAGIPTAGELEERWKKECYDIVNPEEDFDTWVAKKEEEISNNEKYGFWFQERHQMSGQRREFIQELVEDADPTPAHIILTSLMSDGGKKHYVPYTFTPNFDDLLFDAFYLYLEDKPLLVDHEGVTSESKLTREKPTIVKLHGDYHYNNLQNTEEETETLGQGMEDILRQTVGEYGLVVIGYGGKDESIMNALLDTDISEYGIYWCARNPENLSQKAKKLLEHSDSCVVEIEGFESLMAQFAKKIDDVEPPTREDLMNRARERSDRLEGVVEERKEAATDEEEEYLDKWSMFSNAIEAHQKGEYNKSIDIYDELLNQYPKEELAFNNRGNAKQELGEYEAAIKDFTQAIELDPEHALAFYNRGIAKQRLGKSKAAIEDYTRAIELNPEDVKAFNNRGHVMWKLGESNAAIEDYTQAIELDPEHITALLNRAEAEISVGKLEQARQDAKEAETLSSSNERHAASLLLYLISSIVLEIDIGEEEKEYRNLCEKDFNTSWNFEGFDSWLDGANLEAEKETKIKELINLLREHKEDAT